MLAYCFTNFGMRPVVRPAQSVQTSNCPSQCGPAPMPIVGTEIDSVTRQLAEGSLDNLAIKTRYLEYRYGGAEEPAPENN